VVTYSLRDVSKLKKQKKLILQYIVTYYREEDTLAKVVKFKDASLTASLTYQFFAYLIHNQSNEKYNSILELRRNNRKCYSRCEI
jgi:hypothetical protein